MKNTVRAIGLLLILLSPTAVHAQRVAPAGVVRAERASDTNTVTRRADFRFATRTLTAAVGGAAGALGGGLLGANVWPHDCNGCEDAGLEEFIVGFAIGAVTGAGIGAALPRFGNDRCTFTTRLWRALGGAAAGSVTGALLGSTVGETSLFVGGSIGTAFGASAALIGC
jgi:hypothetical protein